MPSIRLTCARRKETSHLLAPAQQIHRRQLQQFGRHAVINTTRMPADRLGNFRSCKRIYIFAMKIMQMLQFSQI